MATNYKFIGFRVPPEIHELVARVSKARGEDITSFARRAVLLELAELNFLPEEQKKALGIQPELVIDGNHPPLLTDKR